MNNTKKENKLRIAFMGAINCVSGSCTLLEYSNSEKGICNYYLVDCGEYQETNQNYTCNKKRVLSLAKKVKAVFLTHAHADHIGLLPDLIENGFKGKIYCTKATMDLTKIMLEDALHIKEQENSNIKQFINQMNFDPIDERPGFLFGNAKNPISIDDGLCMYPLRTGHILGSCSFTFTWIKENSKHPENNKYEHWEAICFSGDVSPCDELSVKNGDAQSILLKDFATPYYSESNRYIVLESTYGDRVRNKKNLFLKKIYKLWSIINKTKKEGGKVLIPAFVLNRMQEILTDLYYIKNKPMQFTRESFIEENLTEEEWLSYFDLVEQNITFSEQNQEFQDALYLKEFPQPDRIKNYITYTDGAPFNSIPEHAQIGIINILNALYKRFYSGMYINYGYYSSLTDEVNQIYQKNLFDCAMNKNKEIKYNYISPQFFKTFLPQITETEKKLEEGKKLINDILSNDYSHSRLSPIGPDEKLDTFFYRNDVCLFSNNFLNSENINKLVEFLKDEKNTLVLTGYQGEGTNGALLKKLGQGVYNEQDLFNIKLNNTEMRLYEVKCKIEDMSAFYSGHADQEQLVEYVHGFNNTRGTQNIFPATVFLNHGTQTQREALKKAIEEKNNGSHKIKAVLPESFKWINLNTGGSEEFADIEIENKHSGTSYKTKITVKDTIDIFYPETLDPRLLAKIINAVNTILD
ncbi:MBL fold metallo-hydrolase [Treponema denticola]|uniref:MBL fold metallo-hydrolase n=1 Tax=Treponema denticola TaxID=158 RepID=UPI002104393B|nr:MBL fold metallo-hydrolase [Treponema denticola]UTY22967.1 MBL fold metallo-hydrolase [Treponema denticola]